MQYRCTNGFTTGDRTVAGGALVESDDPIVGSHGAFFVPVGEPVVKSPETASADLPRAKRGRPRKAPAEIEVTGGDPAASAE